MAAYRNLCGTDLLRRMQPVAHRARRHGSQFRHACQQQRNPAVMHPTGRDRQQSAPQGAAESKSTARHNVLPCQRFDRLQSGKACLQSGCKAELLPQGALYGLPGPIHQGCIAEDSTKRRILLETRTHTCQLFRRPPIILVAQSDDPAFA